MKPLCVIVVGRIGSGKSTIAREVAKEKDMKFFEMSDLIHEITGRQRDTIRLNNLTAEEVAAELVKKLDIEKSWVISGVRQAGIIKKLKKYFRVEVIKIDINLEERFRRVISRGEETTIEQIEAEDTLDSKLGLDIIMNKECFTISNIKWKVTRVVSEIANHLRRYEELI